MSAAAPSTVVKKKGGFQPGQAGSPERLWKKGASGNPKGRQAGVKSQLREWKQRYVYDSGMTPVDFLVAVYRNELYTKFDKHLGADGRSFVFTPAKGAKHVPADLSTRVTAASQAAVYLHRRMPIAIDGGEGKPITLATANELARMPEAELQKLAHMLETVAGTTIDGESQIVEDAA